MIQENFKISSHCYIDYEYMFDFLFFIIIANKCIIVFFFFSILSKKSINHLLESFLSFKKSFDSVLLNHSLMKSKGVNRKVFIAQLIRTAECESVISFYQQ